MKINEKDTKQEIVPALRFPEFRKNEEWNIPHLRQISTRIITRVGNSKLLPVSISAGVGFLPQTEKFGRDISGEQYRNYIVLNRGEFAYNKGNSKKYPQGCVYRLEEFDRVAAPNAFLCFRFNDNVVPDFFKGYFDSNYHGKQLQNVITSGARSNGLLNISADEFFNIILPTPKDKEEQQKIADCLSSIDALIKAAENKIDELKAHKKGLMQQLFPAEGKTVPALRFPEFQNTGEWQQTTIGAICTISNGKSNVQDNVRNGKYPLFDRSEIIKASNKFLFDCEAIIIPGEGRFIPKYYIGKFDLHQRAYALKDFTCHALFVYHYVTAFSFILAQKAVKSTVLSLRMPILEAFPLLLPNIQEQQKIADCLSSVDNLIIAQTNRLEALKAHKKGLMQQLFPNIE